MSKICHIVGCPRSIHNRTIYCSKHANKKICKLVDCGTPAYARQLCIKHGGHGKCKIAGTLLFLFLPLLSSLFHFFSSSSLLFFSESPILHTRSATWTNQPGYLRCPRLASYCRAHWWRGSQCVFSHVLHACAHRIEAFARCKNACAFHAVIQRGI